MNGNRMFLLVCLVVVTFLVLLSGCAPQQPDVMEEKTAEETQEGSDQAGIQVLSDQEVQADLEKLPLEELNNVIAAGEADKGKPLTQQVYNNPDWLTIAYKVKLEKVTGEGTAAGSEDTADAAEEEKLNNAPVFDDFSNQNGAEGQELEFSISATDEDDDSLSYSVKNAPAGVDLSKSGKFSWTPGFDQEGSYELTFVASDSKTTATKTITLTIANTNRPPQFSEEWELTSKLDLVVNEDYTVFLAATDADGDALEYGVKSKDLAVKVDNSTGQALLEAIDMEPLGYTVTFTVTDGLATIEKTLTVLAFPKTCAKNTACPASHFCGEFTSKCEPWDLNNIKNPNCQSSMNNTATQDSCVSKAIDYWTNDMAGHNLCYKVDPVMTLNSCTITKPTDKYKYDCSFTATCDYSSLY